MKPIQVCLGCLWWPTMNDHIETVVKSCQQCQEHQSMPSSAPLHPWENTLQPWTRIHIDFAGAFLGKMFLLLVNSYSKWIEVFTLSPTNYGSKVTIECLRTAFATHGLPQICVSDNGPSFTSEEFGEFMIRNSIRHVTSAPYHPSTNGAAERTVQSFKNAMHKMSNVNDTDTIHTQLMRFLFAYQITPQTTTSQSPAELSMNRQPRSVLSLVKPDLQRTLLNQHETLISSGSTTKTRLFSQGKKV